MAFTTDTSATGAISLRDRIVARIDAARADFAKYRLYRKTLVELSALTDRDLADMGMHRSAIQGIAMEAAYGK